MQMQVFRTVALFAKVELEFNCINFTAGFEPSTAMLIRVCSDAHSPLAIAQVAVSLTVTCVNISTTSVPYAFSNRRFLQLAAKAWKD